MRIVSPFLAALLLSACATTADQPAGVWTNRAPRFDSEVAAFAANDRVTQHLHCGTVFVGSSSIRLWPNLPADFIYPTIQRGVGGATTAEINSYFNRIIPPTQPARIVFYAGENDLNEGKSPDSVLVDFKRFMALKRKAVGGAPVYFLSVKPSPARIADLPRQRAYNDLVRAYADQERDLVFVDIAAPMMDGPAPRASIFGPDNLHMNRAGYDIWVRTITPALAADPPTANPACRD